MSPEPFVSRAKAPPTKRDEKGNGDENEVVTEENKFISKLKCKFHNTINEVFCVAIKKWRQFLSQQLTLIRIY